MHNNIENQTVFIASNIIELEEVRSTNTYAAELLKERNVPEGTVIVAKNQIVGKGQQGNTWLSESGKNITFSLILFPGFLSASEQFFLTKFISLSVLDFLRKYLPDGLSIKWPNDIYYKDFKISGILIENAIQGGQIKSSVVGIGLNVNQDIFDVTLSNPVSLKQITGKIYDLDHLYQELFKCIEVKYLQLRSGNKSILDKNYHENLYRLNTEALYLINGKKVKAIISGVTEAGLLKVLTGTTYSNYQMKEIHFL